MTEEEQRIKQWLPLAYKVGRSYAKHCPRTAEAEDIISAALEGLVKAARSFVPGRSGFYTHAKNMMVWAICEHHATSNMLMTRGVRTTARARGQEPPVVVSTSAILGFDERASNDDPGAFDAVAEREQHEMLRVALAHLPARTADAVRMYYIDEMTLAEVGDRLKVSRQRADQIIRSGVDGVTRLIRGPFRLNPAPARVARIHSRTPQESKRRWGPPDAHGFSVHYLCNGTGEIRLRRNGKLQTRRCMPCEGKGHARLAEPLATAV